MFWIVEEISRFYKLKIYKRCFQNCCIFSFFYGLAFYLYYLFYFYIFRLLLPYLTLSTPPLSSPPVSLRKSWSLTISLKKINIENFRIRNYFKKDFLNFSFHYVRCCNHPVTFFKKNFLIRLLFFKLSMKLARAIFSSSSSVKSDHLEPIAFSSL